MDTAWFLNNLHEYRSIIWFGVFCLVISVGVYLWRFAFGNDGGTVSPSPLSSNSETDGTSSGLWD